MLKNILIGVFSLFLIFQIIHVVNLFKAEDERIQQIETKGYQEGFKGAIYCIEVNSVSFCKKVIGE